MTNANAKLVMIAGLTVLFAGCAIPFRAPSDVAAIQLERVDSPTVIVEKIWLERKSGQLVVKGYVLKRLNAVSGHVKPSHFGPGQNQPP